jgi:hypothetical protein
VSGFGGIPTAASALDQSKDGAGELAAVVGAAVDGAASDGTAAGLSSGVPPQATRKAAATAEARTVRRIRAASRLGDLSV